MTKRGILLIIVPGNCNDSVNNASGNHAPAPVVTGKLKSKIITNKYERSVMTTHQNRGPKIGSQTSPTNRMTLKNSSCNRYWEPRDRIFKVLEPDGLGKSYSL